MAANKVLMALLSVLQILSDRFLEYVLSWYWGEHKRVKAPTQESQLDIVSKSAVELAELIRIQKYSCYDVVKAYVDQMIATKTELNAVVEGPFAEALIEAKDLDKRIQNGQISAEEWQRKPFLGVPFTTKDSTAVAGRLHTLGLVSRKKTRATEDAECIQLTKEAGGIILATSNVPEVNRWLETRNTVFGQTNNPYDLRRSAGGSSGGEAALISACCTAFGLGTDIGGSIRIPAFNCGIFGHKPTSHLVNTRGCTFRTGIEKETMVVAGPMCRYSKDLMPLFKILVGTNLTNSLRLNEPVNVNTLRYFYVSENGMVGCNVINSETQKVMHKIRDHFKDITGKEVEHARLPHLELSKKLWRYWMTQEPAEFNNLLGNGKTLNPFLELGKKLMGCSEFTMASIYSLIDAILPPEREELMRKATNELKQALKELLGNDGVLFYHSSPRTAPFHYYPLIKFTDFNYFSIFNVLQMPVTQVPMGLDSNGMPLGIQVVSTHNNDRLCLAVAEELENTFGGWVPPFV